MADSGSPWTTVVPRSSHLCTAGSLGSLWITVVPISPAALSTSSSSSFTPREFCMRPPSLA